MERDIIDNEISLLVKSASEAARNKEFSFAIEILEEAFCKTSQSQLSYNSKTYAKIIPYFQKAGRYAEVESYCLNELFPFIKQQLSRIFSKKPQTMQNWFYYLAVHQCYDKMRLCAKREGNKQDEERFTKEHELYVKKCEDLHDIAKQDQLERDFEAICGIGNFTVKAYNELPCSLQKIFLPLKARLT